MTDCCSAFFLVAFLAFSCEGERHSSCLLCCVVHQKQRPEHIHHCGRLAMGIEFPRCSCDSSAPDCFGRNPNSCRTATGPAYSEGDFHPDNETVPLPSPDPSFNRSSPCFCFSVSLIFISPHTSCYASGCQRSCSLSPLT